MTAVRIARETALHALDALVSRVRWYTRRGLDVPEGIWRAFSLLCYEFGEDPNEIQGNEARSASQVFVVTDHGQPKRRKARLR